MILTVAPWLETKNGEKKGLNFVNFPYLIVGKVQIDEIFEPSESTLANGHYRI